MSFLDIYYFVITSFKFTKLELALKMFASQKPDIQNAIQVSSK